MESIIKCKVCGSNTFKLNDPQIKVTYDVCQSCGFIAKQTSHLPNETQEKERYNHHQNDQYDEYYVGLFKSLINEYINPLNINTVLDYGSGPYPILTNLLKDKYTVNYYDYYYHNNDEYKKQTYDIIVLSEVIEHLYNPLETLDLLISLLNNKGYLLIKTGFRTMDIEKFLTWWYKRDITHVGFYNEDTFNYLIRHYKLNLIKTNHKDTILLQLSGD